jgi:hypothetical protein
VKVWNKRTLGIIWIEAETGIKTLGNSMTVTKLTENRTTT